jgi:hypothetical protein
MRISRLSSRIKICEELAINFHKILIHTITKITLNNINREFDIRKALKKSKFSSSSIRQI